MSELRRLRDRVEQLERLLGKDNSVAHRLRATYEIEPMLADVLAIMFARNFVTHEALHTLLFGIRPDCDQPEMKILDVQICKLRKRLKPHGITIKTQWGQGWSMPKESKDIIRASLAPVVESFADLPSFLPQRAA